MSSIKVFKTTVNDRRKANSIKDEIRRDLPESDPSFDLEDHDKVLRVESPSHPIDESILRKILRNYGYVMEKLF